MNPSLPSKADYTNDEGVRSFGTAELYRGVVKYIAIAYAGYGILFLFYDHFILAAAGILSAAVNFYFLVNKKITFSAMVIAEHVCAIITSYLLVSQLGWQYGFQYLIFLTIGLGFFSPFKRKIIPLIFNGIEIALYVYLYITYSDKPPIFDTSDVIIKTIHASYFVLVSLLLIVSMKKADIANFIHREEIIAHTIDLHKKANYDDLTKLLNRRAMSSLLEACWEQYRSTGEVFHLIMGDIDLFKQVNDTYGHQTGDKVLREVANILGRALESPITSRVGVAMSSSSSSPKKTPTTPCSPSRNACAPASARRPTSSMAPP